MRTEPTVAADPSAPLDSDDDEHAPFVGGASGDVEMRPLSSARDADDDDDEEDEDDDGRVLPYPCARRVADNPALSVATACMGVVALALNLRLWTGGRASRGWRSFAAGGSGPPRHSHDDAGPRVPRRKNRTRGGGWFRHAAFPAEDLLGIAADGRGGGSSAAAAAPPPYDLADFRYQEASSGRNRTLLYWEEVVEAATAVPGGEEIRAVAPGADPWANLSAWGPCYPRALPEPRHGGRSLLRNLPRNWTDIVQSNAGRRAGDDDGIVYPSYPRYHHGNLGRPSSAAARFEGLCRPGFLIIGQGKCGTSSLYYYLAGHPRVLPAKKKQIHYFIYYRSKSLEWYYGHFPAIESFLGRGALMTGEASPGYMPYPDVRFHIKQIRNIKVNILT